MNYDLPFERAGGVTMAINTTPFDIAEHLNTTEDIRDFLNEVAETGDETDFIHALNMAARAMGMTEGAC